MNTDRANEHVSCALKKNRSKTLQIFNTFSKKNFNFFVKKNLPGIFFLNLNLHKFFFSIILLNLIIRVQAIQSLEIKKNTNTEHEIFSCDFVIF